MPKKISKKTKDEIKRKIKEGYIGKELAEDYKVTPQFITGLKNELTAEEARRREAEEREREEDKLTVKEKLDSLRDYQKWQGHVNWVKARIYNEINAIDKLKKDIDWSYYVKTEDKGHAYWELSSLKEQFELLIYELDHCRDKKKLYYIKEAFIELKETAKGIIDKYTNRSKQERVPINTNLLKREISKTDLRGSRLDRLIQISGNESPKEKRSIFDKIVEIEMVRRYQNSTRKEDSNLLNTDFLRMAFQMQIISRFMPRMQPQQQGPNLRDAIEIAKLISHKY